jgi:hypothetical protein
VSTHEILGAHERQSQQADNRSNKQYEDPILTKQSESTMVRVSMKIHLYKPVLAYGNNMRENRISMAEISNYLQKMDAFLGTHPGFVDMPQTSCTCDLCG